MAVKLLQVLLLGVIAAAAEDDVPVRWVMSPRAAVACEVPDSARIPARRPPPPLDADLTQRPKPYIWRRGSDELKRVSLNGTLEVSRKKDPEGVYQCAVKYQGGYVLGYPLHLKYAFMEKQFSVHPSNSSAWRGQPFLMRCEISSGPPAQITWLKDGEPLPKNERYHALDNQLLISEVKDDDAGLYRCRATNTVLNKVKMSHGGRLQVEDGPSVIEQAFVPVHHEELIEVPRESRVVLPCPMYGKPKPKLLWEFKQPNSRTAELDFVDEVLVLTNIQPDQEGVYVCRDENNEQLFKTFNVTIIEPVNITNPPESKQVVRASTVRFNCTAVGKPTPKITWYKDGKEIKYAGRIDLVLSADDKRLRQLLIRSVTSEDAGVYQCVARQRGAVASSWSWVEVTGAEAAAPSALRCAPLDINTVRVRWTPHADTVVAYTVITTSPDGNSLPDSPVKVTEKKITVKSPLTPYGFQVRAYIRSPSQNNNNTANVVSDISETVYCQGQGVPIKLTKNEEGLIVVSWWQFYRENPGVAQWMVQYKLQNSTEEHNITVDGHVYNYTLGVGESSGVEVRVLGTRRLPWLQQDLALVPWTPATALHTQTRETQPIPEDVEVSEVNARNFTVRWQFEPQAMPGDYVYFVCVRRLAGNQECMESTENWAVVINLLPDTQYEVRVQARVAGQSLGGDFTHPILITTKPDGKGNLRDLTYKYVNQTAVRVSWNSDPREYTVRYTDEFNLLRNQWNAVEVIGNTVLLTDLNPSKDLYVIVEGHEPVGHSPKLVVPAQIPKVKELQYEYVGSGVRVWWLGSGPRLVRYSQNLTQTLDEWRTINVTDSSVQITGLDWSRQTYVMVAAPGPSQHNQVLTIDPRPEDNYDLYLGIAVGFSVLLICLLTVGVFCAWQKRKRSRTSMRTRRRRSSNDGNEEDGSEMKNVGGRLANGGGSKDAGEPLLNGHVHITENPSSKTPNGKVWRGRYSGAFDVSRYESCDAGAEARGAERDSYAKPPDDNMNTAHFEVTLQPNG